MGGAIIAVQHRQKWEWQFLAILKRLTIIGGGKKNVGN
jgi:hypothetical protein